VSDPVDDILEPAVRVIARQIPIEALRAAICDRPWHGEAWHELAMRARWSGDMAAAERLYARTLICDPMKPGVRWNRGLTLLAMGDLDRAWPEYEARFAAQRSCLLRHQGRPPWRGERLDGKRLLVWAEQGVGDEIVFASCIDDLRHLGGEVILHCSPRLQSLWKRSFPWATVTNNDNIDTPRFDLQTPSGSVMRHMRPGWASFPKVSAPLKMDPEKAADWRRWLRPMPPGPRIGICWRGRLTDRQDRHLHYATLFDMIPLFHVFGAQLICLQYGDGVEEEMAEFGFETGLPLRVPPGLDRLNDFDGVAALMSELDLVIAPDTACGALAGAVGCDVWSFAMPGDPLCLGRTDRHPFLPSMRLWQKQPGAPWGPVFERMAAELQQRAGRLAWDQGEIEWQVTAYMGAEQVARLAERSLVH
jgi:hypothetical protein